MEKCNFVFLPANPCLDFLGESCEPACWQLRSSWLSSARVISHSVGDFPLRGKMSVKLTKGSGKNVGVADKGEGHPLKKGNKLFPLTKQTSWSRSMDEEQATAVRLLKKQNGTKYRNFVWSDCKLEYRIRRTVAQANSEANSPDGMEEVSRRSHSCISSKANGLTSAGKRGQAPAFAWVSVHRPVCSLIANSISIF